MTEIDNRIAALEAQLAELKATIAPNGSAPAAATEPAAPVLVPEVVDQTTDRRSAFKKLAGVAAGVAAGGVLLARPEPAAATAGDPWKVNAATNGDGSAPASIGGSGLFMWASNGNSAVSGDGGNRRPIIWVTDFSLLFNQTNEIGFYADMNGTNSAGMMVHGTAVGARISSAEGATLILGNSTIAVPPTTGAWEQGTLLRKDDELWMCVTAGTPGGWTRLTASTASAGELFLLDKPVRVYDSRATSNGPAATGDGPLAGGTERTVSLANGFVNTTATPAVPAGATAALITLTVTGTTNAGFMAVFSNAVAYPGTSNINWSASGQDIATTTVSAVDAAAKVKLHGGGSPTGTNFIIDVTGFYG